MEISEDQIQIFTKFKKAVEEDRHVDAHRLYDEMLLKLAHLYEPSVVKLFDKQKGKMNFGYEI